MSAPDGNGGNSGGRCPSFEPVAWFVAALALYVLLAKDAFYKTDGPDLIRFLHEGSPHPWHLAYLPLLRLFRGVLEAVGGSPTYMQLGTWFSALGAATAVSFACAGLRCLGVRPTIARVALTLFALSPGVLLFATVVELHAPLLGAFGISFWWVARMTQRPSWLGMAVLGVLTHGTFLMHTSGLFLPVWLLAFFIAWRWPEADHRRDALRALLALAVHGVLFIAMPRLFPALYGLHADFAASLAMQSQTGRPRSLDYAPWISLQEWLWPLLPVSVLVLLTPFKPALRREFAAFAIGWLPFLYLSVALLVFEPEHGAYFLPMVLPASLLTARLAGVRWWRHALCASLLGLLPIATTQRSHMAAQRAFDDAFTAGVTEAAASRRPFVIVGTHREMAAAFARLEPDEFLWARHVATLPRATFTDDDLEETEVYLRRVHAQGQVVLLTQAAMDSLRDPAANMRAESDTAKIPTNEEMAGPLVRDLLERDFLLEEVVPGFLRVTPRQ